MAHAAYSHRAAGNWRRFSKPEGTPEERIKAIGYIAIPKGIADRIGYMPRVGDIILAKNGHGDIVTPQGKVGGNLRDYVKIAQSEDTIIITNSREAKEAYLKAKGAIKEQKLNTNSLFKLISEVLKSA